MKKITIYLLTITALLSFTPTPSMARNESSIIPTEKVEKIESAEAKAMISRLEEIKAMDKSNMSSMEKKALRKEVRSIKKSLAQTSGGVYLSVGAIIIIVLLLILLL
jgi:hypothetical protein